ncbi:FAR1-related sequence 5-like protein [Theobroma cacao]|uniref:FAR1-related sequence 5-like protein n=1 Tax=Theobroma cacao TaxID=3641 RepID=A0A061G6T4_THECC|nr:FAR1-related sequence 5-like protein [Theobroma cacao]
MLTSCRLMESQENNLSDAKYLHELSKDEILGLEFDDLEDVYEFYKAYACAMGLGVHKGSCRRNKNGIEVMKHFACSKEGHRAEKWEKLENWVREPKRHIKVVDVYEAKAMKVAGIKTCQVMNVFAAQVGGIQNVGFTRKDFYNRMAAKRHAKVNDGDVQATLLYFGVKKEIDNGFYMKHTTYDDNKLKNLFWADSISRLDYACFGDVLAYDTTYKKNTFNLPLLVFIGVNHHHMTTIFALALLTNEDAESYIWALTTFLECMMNKKPISVVIDGDRAMRKALEMVFPGVRHRLCSWHLARNAQANVPLPGFV